ncbi:MAG: rhodanese y domain and YceI domain protein [Akkermansiaceae bacterium]|nr:rhodanese y domain and YceI domain protein [Akkermansiaceae bacterium]
MSAAPLIDVLSSESFAREHIPGAVNLCVYETAFPDKVRAAFPDPSAPLQVYGLCPTALEVRTALTRLREAGYQNVTELKGGLEGWKAAGGVPEGAGFPEEPASGTYRIDAAASFVRWTGTNVLNFHHGQLSLSAGSVTIERGELKGGSFRIDMNSLSCADLTDSAMNAMLIKHLRSDDFFAVADFPVAEFTITAATPVAALPGLPNCRITGLLSLRGATRVLEIPASITHRDEGGYTARAFFGLDRTLWGSYYGSGRFFSRIGMHLVDDLVQIHLHVVTEKASTHESSQ